MSYISHRVTVHLDLTQEDFTKIEAFRKEFPEDEVFQIQIRMFDMEDDDHHSKAMLIALDSDQKTEI